MFREIKIVERYVFHSGHVLENWNLFSVRLFRNLTPPSGEGWPMFALGLDRIRRDGCGCSGQMLNTDARA